MTWDVNLVLMLRVLINDLNPPQKNTDEYLERVIVTAGIFVSSEIDLPFDYVYDIDAITIVPDPIIVNDSVSEALLPLKSACIINQGDFQKAIGQGIKVRDGDSAIDTSVSFRGFRDILELGACSAYDKLRFDIEKLNAAGSGGLNGFVLGPFREPDSVRSDFDTLSWYFDRFATALHGDSRNSRR